MWPSNFKCSCFCIIGIFTPLWEIAGNLFLDIESLTRHKFPKTFSPVKQLLYEYWRQLTFPVLYPNILIANTLKRRFCFWTSQSWSQTRMFSVSIWCHKREETDYFPKHKQTFLSRTFEILKQKHFLVEVPLLSSNSVCIKSMYFILAEAIDGSDLKFSTIWTASSKTEPKHNKTNKMSCVPAKTQIPPVWSVFTVHSMGSQGTKACTCTHPRLWSEWEDAQADLSLCWVHMSFNWLRHLRLNPTSSEMFLYSLRQNTFLCFLQERQKSVFLSLFAKIVWHNIRFFSWSHICLSR